MHQFKFLYILTNTYLFCFLIFLNNSHHNRFSLEPCELVFTQLSLGSSVPVLTQLVPGSTAILICGSFDHFLALTSHLKTFTPRRKYSIVLWLSSTQNGLYGNQMRPSNRGALCSQIIRLQSVYECTFLTCTERAPGIDYLLRGPQPQQRKQWLIFLHSQT